MIYPLQINDLQVVKTLAHQIWPVCYAKILDKDQIDYMLQKFYSIQNLENLYQNKHNFVVLYQEEQPVGFASYEHNSENSNKTKLHKLYVDTNLHKKGLGQKLMNYVIMQTAVQGDTTVYLNVNRNNDALNFYEKNNFKIVKTEDIDIGNGFLMEDYVMEKTL